MATWDVVPVFYGTDRASEPGAKREQLWLRSRGPPGPQLGAGAGDCAAQAIKSRKSSALGSMHLPFIQD